MQNITIKQSPINEVLTVNSKITEFLDQYTKKEFEERYKDKEHLITVAYIDDKPAGYIVWYDRDNDNSFYCWMAAVDPKFRRLGVLKQLMDYGVLYAKEKGYKKITIKTRNNKRNMLSYLVNNGFLFTNVITSPDINENRIKLEKLI